MPLRERRVSGEHRWLHLHGRKGSDFLSGHRFPRG